MLIQDSREIYMYNILYKFDCFFKYLSEYVSLPIELDMVLLIKKIKTQD